MSFRHHIVSCNNYDPAHVVPLFSGRDRVGLLRRDNAAALQRFPDVFAVADDRVNLVARGDVAAVSRAVDAVVDALVAEKRVPKWRNETFDVTPRWGAPAVEAVIAHTNLYWEHQAAPGRTARVESTAEVDLGPG